jgi:hypothetical protein
VAVHTVVLVGYSQHCLLRVRNVSCKVAGSLGTFTDLEYSSGFLNPHTQTNKKTTNSVALVRDRSIATERPPLVGEGSANFWGWRVLRGKRNGSPWPYSRLSRPEPLLYLPSSSSIVLTRLSGHSSISTTSQKMW